MSNDSTKINTRIREQILKSEKGSGIGLKICYDLANISNVKLKSEPNSGGGTNFFLNMPKKILI